MPKGIRGGKQIGAGRPKGSVSKSTALIQKAKELIIQRVSKELTPIINKLIEKAKIGDIKAVEILFERAFGKAPQALSFEEGANEILIRWGK